MKRGRLIVHTTRYNANNRDYEQDQYLKLTSLAQE
ncbi:hypothetical protein KSS87_016394, partial [Heliosperma pusillum]